jgi:hypothetical protein
MKRSAKILKFKKKKLKTIEEVRAALIAIHEDIESGDATIAEAISIKKEMQILVRKLETQMKSVKPKDRAALKSFFGKYSPTWRTPLDFFCICLLPALLRASVRPG